MSAPTPGPVGSSGGNQFNLPALNIPSVPAATPQGNAPKKKNSLLPEKVRPALFTIGGLALLMVIAQLVNTFSDDWLNRQFGLVSRQVAGLDGVLFAPLLHANWQHLLSNLVPLLIFGLLLFVGGVRQFVVVTVLVWALSGLGLWLIGPGNTVTVGASGLIFGWLAYLLARGIFTRNFGQIAIGLVLLVLYGGMFVSGIVTTAFRDAFGTTNISWQGHLMGALAGVLAAFLVAKADGSRRKQVAA